MQERRSAEVIHVLIPDVWNGRPLKTSGWWGEDSAVIHEWGNGLSVMRFWRRLCCISPFRYGNLPPDFVFVERKTHKESWKGEESVKERFTIAEEKVVAFIDGACHSL